MKIIVKEATTFKQRLRGLMWKKEMDHEGLLLRNCAQVHTCFMKFEICILFLNEKDEVLDHQRLQPWGVSKRVRGTKHILETIWNTEQAKGMAGKSIEMEVL